MLEIRETDRPHALALGLSLALHVAALAIFLLARAAPPFRVSPVPLQVTNLAAPPSVHLAYGRASGTQTSLPTAKARLSIRPVIARAPAASASAAEEVERVAEKETAAMMRGLDFKGIYGFFPGHEYKLPVRRSGELPHVSADQAPISQMVVIAITINSEGKVVRAHIVAGEIAPGLQQVLLAAAKDLQYIPAKRDNVPIASQLELVVPIPG